MARQSNGARHADPLATAAQDMEIARLVVGRAAPLFQPFLMDLRLLPSPGVGTMASTARGLVMYDPETVANEWSLDEVAGVFYHEALHVFLRHGTRIGGRDPLQWNLAGDRAINQTVLDAGFKLPGEPCLHTDLGLPPYLSADGYYRAPEQQQGGNAGQGQPGKGQGQQGKGGKPGPGSGHCGSCAGHKGPGEPDDPGPAEEDAGCRSVDMLEQRAREVGEAIADAASKNPGTVPAGLARMVSDLLRPAKVDWRAKLRRVVRNAVRHKAGNDHHDWSRLSRRQWGAGFGEGRPLLSASKDYVPEVVIALDTSGSMGGAELEASLGEVQGILKATGAKVRVVSCDCSVHADGYARRLREVAKLVKGGGGTDFRPVFALLEKGPPPDAVVFFTDGYGPAPEHEPRAFHTIWVLVGKHVTEPAPWGSKVRVED